MDGQVPAEIMDERLQLLQAALQRSSLAFNRTTEGRRCQVLVERHGRREGQWLGKSPWLQSVYFANDLGGDVAIGDLVEVELVEAGPNSLRGALVAPDAA
jgi:tRNA-2-methylthio-N6-dimethylallyladenosine synthase